MTTKRAAPSSAGSVFLGASQEGFRALAAEALAGIARTRPRVATSYAPVAGEAKSIAFMKRLSAKIFAKAEVRDLVLPGEAPEGDADTAREVLAWADLVYVSGGDPVMAAEHFDRAGAAPWLREARERGAAFLGISAGSMVLGAWWASWPDEPPPGAHLDGARLVPCTGLVPDLVIDCHAEDDGWTELFTVSALLDARAHARLVPPNEEVAPPRARRVGVPTGGSLIVAPDGALRVVGAPLFTLP